MLPNEEKQWHGHFFWQELFFVTTPQDLELKALASYLEEQRPTWTRTLNFYQEQELPIYC